MTGATKVAVITGAARGIGAATVRKFVDEGYYAVAVDMIEHSQAPLMGTPPNGLFQYIRCDVSDESQVEGLMRGVGERHGKLDVLVNIAGVVLVKPLEETSWNEYQRLVNVNLGGTFLMIKHAIPLMKQLRGGAIVNAGSVSGHVGQIDHSLYGATKGAIIALGRALAWELAPHEIRVNSVSPGSVDTPMLRSDVEIEAERTGRPDIEVKKEREEEQALGRWADPSEIAEAIYFLASSSASFITGADLLVDSGWVAK